MRLFNLQRLDYTYLLQNIGIFIIVLSFFDIADHLLNIGTLIAFSGAALRKVFLKQPFFDLKSQNIPRKFLLVFFSFIALQFVALYLNDIPDKNYSTLVNYAKWLRGYLLLFLFYNNNINYLQLIWAAIAIGMAHFCIGGANILNEYFVLNIVRPSGFFDNPNILAGYLVLLLPVVFAGLFDKRFNKTLKIFVALIFLLGSFSLILTESRGGLLGIVIVGIVSIIYHAKNQKQMLLNLFSILLVCLVTSYIFVPQNLQRFARVFQFSEITSYQDKARVYIWERTLKIIGDEPVLGVGVGNFEKVFTSDKYKPTAGRENTSSQPHPHNMFLYSLVETGIVGTCGLLAVYIYQICFCYKRRYKLTQNIYTNMFLFTMMAIFIHGMVDTFYTRKMFFQLYLVIWGYACLSVLENTKAELKSTK